jgi:hypothetical protein
MDIITIVTTIIIVISGVVVLFLIYLCFTTPPLFCPGVKKLWKKGYAIRYLGRNYVEGVSRFDSLESVNSNPNIWQVSKKKNGNNTIVGWVFAMNNNTFYKEAKTQHTALVNGDFIDIMASLKATKIFNP